MGSGTLGPLGEAVAGVPEGELITDCESEVRGEPVEVDNAGGRGPLVQVVDHRLATLQCSVRALVLEPLPIEGGLARAIRQPAANLRIAPRPREQPGADLHRGAPKRN